MEKKQGNEAKISFEMFNQKELATHSKRLKQQQKSASYSSFVQEIGVENASLSELAIAKVEAASETKLQHNSKYIVEITISACSRFFQSTTEEIHKNWYSNSRDWIKSEFGKNLVQLDVYRDQLSRSMLIKAYVVPLKYKVVNLRRNTQEIDDNKLKTKVQLRLCAHEMFSSVEKRGFIERYNQVMATLNLECKTRKPSQRSFQQELNTLKELLENKQERIEILADHSWYQVHMLNEVVEIVKGIDTSRLEATFLDHENAQLLERYVTELTEKQSVVASIIEELTMN